MERFYDIECDPEQIHALNLAFIGDSVFDIFIREKLVCTSCASVNTLHGKAAKLVCCSAQASDAKLLLPLFTDEENKIFLRGRNAHCGHIPKNASVADYHASTALEAVFGYLYLSGNIERLKYFISIILEAFNEE